MTGIPIYEKHADDFSTNGLGLLTHIEAEVEERAAGMYELTIVQPIDETYRWAQVQGGCIIKVPVPVRESPIYEAEADDTGETVVVRDIYKVVKTSVGVWLRTGPSRGSKALKHYPNDTQVVKMGDVQNSYMPVVMVNGGAEGWMHTKYLAPDYKETETITPEKPGGNILQLEQSRDQLFRVYSMETDTKDHTVTAKAMHVFYDQRGNLIDAEYEPSDVDVVDVAKEIESKLLEPNPITWRIQKLTGKVSGTFSYKTPVEAYMDPDEGIIKQTKALLVRDNFNAYLLPDAVRDRGVTVRRKKNLIGVRVNHDESNIVTRVIPVGKNKKGDPLYLDGKKYVERKDVEEGFDDSIYTAVMTKRIEYDVSVGTPNDENKGKVFKNETEARAELKRIAGLEFTENGIDLPSYGMEVDFVLLQNTPEYANYASLQAVHLYDTVTVIDELIGLSAKLRVTGYKWNPLTKQYTSITLGELLELKQTVYNFNIANGSVSGNKIMTNSADGSIMRDASIQYAKIAVAAIQQLTADSITALIARINEVVAGKITTDELYAGIAEIVALKVSTLTADNIKTDTLAVELAKAQLLIAASGVFDKLTVQQMVAEALHLTFGVGDTVFIKNLSVDFAQMVSAQIGSLVIKATDGNYYALDVDANGNVSATPVTVTEGETSAGQTEGGKVILETNIAASNLSTSNLLATFALVNRIDAARIDVDQLFAREAFISKLTTSLIVGGKSLTQIAGEATDAKNRIDGLQIGGRNLFTGTQNFSGGSWNYALPYWTDAGETWQGCAVKMKSSPWDGLSQPVSVKAGEEYTLSAWVKRSAGATVIFYCEDTDRNDTTLTHSTGPEWTRISMTFRRLSDGTMTPRFENSAYGETLYICGLKLEKGNIATEWTPAPEDAQAEIDFATAYDSQEPPETPPAAGKLWVDRGTTPPIFRRWKGENVSTEREWSEAFAPPTAENPNAYYDNSSGLLESVDSVLTTFTPGQTGSGDPSPDNYRPLAGFDYIQCLQNSYGQTTETFIKGEIRFGKIVYGADIDWIGGVWKQTYWEYVLTGTESVNLITVQGYPRFDVAIPAELGAQAASFTPICTHLLGSESPYSYNNLDNAVCVNKDLVNSPLYIRCDRFSTPDELKSWFAAQYAAGTPVRVVFPLLAPVAHSFAPANIGVFSSYLYINVSGYANGSYNGAVPNTLAVEGSFSGWQTLNSTEDIRAAQGQIQLQQANAQAAIDELRTAVVTDNEGVHVRKVDNENNQLTQNELLITQKDLNMVVNGKRSSTYGDGYIRLLDMVIRVAAGGIVIEAAEG